ncbi:hypothetical protein GCM10023185_15900 [Hymenobacter saemangeumensis]|uniref:Response regulator transcription factor n=1 Tax=Hymenobacter saemangeumensis TaxID=1084522 RepID=A0ABP8I9W9_9BACT
MSTALPSPPPSQADASQALRVLVVEDEPLYALQLRICLDELGYLALGPASDASQALALFTSSSPDLVLLDIGLHGEVDGISLAGLLRAQRPDLPILFITAFSDRATFERAKALGPLAYVNKPFTVTAVQYAIELAVQQMGAGTSSAASEAGSRADWTAARPPVAKAAWPEDVLVRDAFFVKNRDRLLKIERANVQTIEASGDYSLLRTVNAGQFLLSLSLTRLEEKLLGTSFLRVHRSWLVNMDLVDEVLLHENAIRLGTLHVPVSTAFRPELLRRLPLLS